MEPFVSLCGALVSHGRNRHESLRYKGGGNSRRCALRALWTRALPLFGAWISGRPLGGVCVFRAKKNPPDAVTRGGFWLEVAH